MALITSIHIYCMPARAALGSELVLPPRHSLRAGRRTVMQLWAVSWEFFSAFLVSLRFLCVPLHYAHALS